MGLRNWFKTYPYWGDVVLYPMIFVLIGMIVVFHYSDNFSLFNLLAYIFVLPIAFSMRLAWAQFKKQKSLRNFQYLIGFLNIILTIFALILGFSLERWALGYVAHAIWIVFFALATIRPIIWLYKRHQAKKAEANHD